MSLANNIRSARRALKMSQDELAEAIGANRVTISRYETGSYLPSVSALEKLAAVLNTTPNELMGDSERPQGEPPRTQESIIISHAVDRMPKEQREQAESILRTLFSKYFTEEEDKIS